MMEKKPKNPHLTFPPLVPSPSVNFPAEMTYPRTLARDECIFTCLPLEAEHGSERTSKLHDATIDTGCRLQPTHRRRTAVANVTIPATALSKLEVAPFETSAVVDVTPSCATRSRTSSALALPSATVTSSVHTENRTESIVLYDTSSTGETGCSERPEATCAVGTSHSCTVSSHTRASLSDPRASSSYAHCSPRKSGEGATTSGVITEKTTRNTGIAESASERSAFGSNPSFPSCCPKVAQDVRMAVCGVSTAADAPSPSTKTAATSIPERGSAASSTEKASIKTTPTAGAAADVRAQTSFPELQAKRRPALAAKAGVQTYATPPQVPAGQVARIEPPGLTNGQSPASTMVAYPVATHSRPKITVARCLLLPTVSDEEHWTSVDPAAREARTVGSSQQRSPSTLISFTVSATDHQHPLHHVLRKYNFIPTQQNSQRETPARLAHLPAEKASPVCLQPHDSDAATTASKHTPSLPTVPRLLSASASHHARSVQEAKTFYPAVFSGGRSRTTEKAVASLPSVEVCEQISVSLTKHTPQTNASSSTFVYHDIVFGSGCDGDANSVDHFPSKLSSPALVTRSERADVMAVVVEPTTTVPLSKESKVDPLVRSASVTSPQRPVLLEHGTKVEQLYHSLSHTDKHTQAVTTMGNASDLLRSTEGPSTLETGVTKMGAVAPETRLSSMKREECARIEPGTMRSQKEPQTRKAAGTLHPVAHTLQHLSSCAAASPRSACSACRPEVVLHDILTFTVKQPLLAPTGAQAMTYGLEQEVLGNPVEQPSSLENEEDGGYKAAECIESTASAGCLQKEEAFHVCQNSEAPAGARYGASCGDKETFETEGESVEMTRTQQPAISGGCPHERTAHLTASDVAGGVSASVSYWTRRGQNPSEPSLTSIEPCPQTHAVNVGHIDLRGTADGSLFDSASFSRRAENCRKDSRDTKYSTKRRARDSRAKTDHKEGTQTSREDQTTVDECEACKAELEEGREGDSPPVLRGRTLSALKHRREEESSAEEIQVGQAGNSTRTNGRFSTVESNFKDGDRGDDRDITRNERKEEGRDGKVYSCSSEPSMGPQAGQSIEETEKTQVAAAVVAAVDFCQKTKCVKDEGKQEGTPAGSEGAVLTHCDTSCAGDGRDRELSGSSASLASKAAALEQTLEGAEYTFEQDAPARSPNAGEEKLASRVPKWRMGTFRQGGLEGQTGAEPGGRTATEHAAAASDTAAGDTAFASQEHAFTEATLSQKFQQDSLNDRAVPVKPVCAVEGEEPTQDCFSGRVSDEAVTGFKQVACERGGQFLPNLKKCVREGDTDTISESIKRRTISRYNGEIDFNIFSSQVGADLPSSFPVVNIPLPDIKSSTQVEIVPYYHLKCRQPSHLLCSRLSPSDHLSECQPETTLIDNVHSEDSRPCKRPGVTADVMHPISEGPPAKLTCRCVGWTSRTSPLSRRQRSAHAVLSPPVNSPAPHSSTLLYSVSNRVYEGLPLQEMSTKEMSARGNVSRLTNSTARSACAACELRVRGSCTGSAQLGELRDMGGESCGLRGDTDRVSHGVLFKVGETLSAGRHPDAPKVYPSETATLQNHSALHTKTSALSFSDTSKIQHGCMFSVAAASPPYQSSTLISPTFYRTTRQQLPRSSAAGCTRAVSAPRTSTYDNNSSGGWEMKSKISSDNPRRWAHNGALEVLNSRLPDSVRKGGWKIDRNGEHWRFLPNDTVAEVGGGEKVNSHEEFSQVPGLDSLTQALQEATSFFDSVDETVLNSFRDAAESMESESVGDRDLADTALPSGSISRVFSKANNLSHPSKLRSILASQSLTRGQDAVAQAKSKAFMHSHSRLRALRKARVTAPFKPPAASVPRHALVPYARVSRQTPRRNVTTKLPLQSAEPCMAGCRAPRRGTSLFVSSPLSRLSVRKTNVVAWCPKLENGAETSTAQCHQDLALLLRVAGVAPGDVLEVRFPFLVTEAENREASKVVSADEKICSILDSDVANVPVKPSVYAGTTQAPWQQIDEGSRKGLLRDESVSSVAISPGLSRSGEEELQAAPTPNGAPLDTVQNSSGKFLGKGKATASEKWSWVQAEVILPEIREIEPKSCRRIMQLTYRSLPGLSTNVIFLGFHHLLCLGSSQTLNENKTPQRRVRRVGGETKEWVPQGVTPFVDGRLMSTLHGRIIEFRKPVDILAARSELDIRQVAGPFSAADILGGRHIDRTQATQRSPAVEPALLEEFTKLPLATQINVASRYGQFSHGFMSWLQDLVQRQDGHITQGDIHQFASDFELPNW